MQTEQAGKGYAEVAHVIWAAWMGTCVAGKNNADVARVTRGQGKGPENVVRVARADRKFAIKALQR